MDPGSGPRPRDRARQGRVAGGLPGPQGGSDAGGIFAGQSEALSDL